MNGPAGTWPTFRHDEYLSGHQSLPGQIVRPTVAWQTRLGGPVFDAHVVDIDGRQQILVPFGGCLQAFRLDGKLVWKTRPCGVEGIIGIVDIDCDGRVEIVASNGRCVVVFSAHDGMILFETYVGPPFSGGLLFTCALLHHFDHVGTGYQLAVGLLSSREVVLFDFSSGAKSPERRHILWMDDFFHPTVLAADIDNDGDEELIITKLSSVFVFDPASGRLKAECRWSSGGTPRRNYGLFDIRDLNGDGRLDMLIMSYVVSRHIAVVEHDGVGRLRSRWDRFIEHVYPHDECELRYTTNSCCDLDADGKQEIVASIFNDRRDGRWWLEIMDAWDGEVRWALPDTYLLDIIRSTNGQHLILASTEKRRVPDEFTNIKLLRWDGGQVDEVWSASGMGIFGRYVPSSATTTVFKEDLPPMNAVWQVGGTLLLRGYGDSIVVLSETDDGRWEKSMINGSEGSAAILGVIGERNERRWITSTAEGEVRVIDDSGRVLTRIECGIRYRYGSTLYFTPRPASTPVVFEKDNQRFIAVPDAGWGVLLYAWNRDTDRPDLAWRRPGRGVVGPEEMYHSVMGVVDDGEPILLMSTVGQGEASLQAIDVEGSVRNEWPAPGIPKAPRVASGRTGIHWYMSVDHDGQRSIFVSGFRSGSMNSEVSLCIDRLDNKRLWEHATINAESEEGRGYGPWNAVSVHRLNDQSRIVFMAKDTFCEVDLATGTVVHPGWRMRPFNSAHLRRRGISIDDFSAYGSPAPVTLNDRGDRAWLIHGNYGGTGMFGFDHELRWWRSAPLSSLSSSHFGVADIDNDGLTEIGMSYCDGDFVCLRADTGEEKWRLHDTGVASDVVTCDIDSDGKIEFLMSNREGELLCIGSSTCGCGLVKWRLQFDYSLGPLVVADADGDGLSEILVVAGDGYMYGVSGLA